jgi:DNA end-binding protein Ku
MARPVWTGVISFGLVSVPVALYPATREHDVSFHQFEKGTSDRIRYRRVNERTGKEVDYEDIVRGADVGGGQYVMLVPEELEAIAPGRSRSLEIHTFVDIDEIDPIYYQKSYFLAPGSEETAKTYALLRDSMANANRAAIGTLVMRNKEYLAAIRPQDDVLVLETMFFADEVRDPHKEIDELPGDVRLRSQELKMARQLIDSMSGPWKPEDHRDTYTDRVNELIEAKGQGAEVTLAEQAPDATKATDLMEVLRRSVEAAKGRRGAATAKKAPTAKKATTAKKRSSAAKKSAAQKSAAPKTTAKKSAARKSTGDKSTAKKTTAKKAAKSGSKARKSTARQKAA